ncbi:MAG: hypothetical protein JXR70_00230 [Spirochaetales bacterium]|nr:hypothetical protein [Spirochaetales bacterium]
MSKNGIKIDKLPPFKRAHFFNGLIATPRYWNEIQDYDFRKENFYNSLFHGFGIIEGVMGNLKVQPIQGSSGSSLAVVVNSGAAIDKMGRCIYLYEPQALTVDYRKYKLPTTVYVTIRYKEVMEDFYQNEDNPDLQGYQKKLENGIVDIRNSEPDDKELLELARIYLEEDKNGEIPGIKESKDFANPGPNTIDTRFLAWASVAREGLSPYLKTFLANILDKTRNIAQISHDAISLPSFRDLQVVALTAKMLVQCGDLRFNDVIHVLYPLFDIDNQILQDMLDYERKEEKHLFTMNENFETIKSSVFEIGDMIKSYDGSYEIIDEIIRKHQIFIDGVRNLFVTKKLNINDVMLMSGELPRILLIGEERYTLVDFLDLKDQESINGHQLRFEGNRDVTTSNIALSYPDGEVVRDTIKRYVGGSAHFVLKNIIKKRKLLLIRRTDIVAGNYSIDVLLGDESNRRILNIDTSDSKFRWRNSFVQFEEDEVEDHSIPVEFRMGDTGRDNFAKVWIYQRL